MSTELRSVAHSLGLKGVEIEEFVAKQWDAFLPHEAGHALMAAHIFPTGRITPNSGHYGTPLPDWFDEAAAMWMEPEGMRKRRLGQVRNAATVFSLEEVLSARHYLTNSVARRYSRSILEGPCRGCDWRERADESRRITWQLHFDGRSSVDTAYGSKALGGNVEELLSYAYAFGALSYVKKRGGAEALQDLIERLRANPDYPNPLLGLPGLPRTTDALERDWREWRLATDS